MTLLGLIVAGVNLGTELHLLDLDLGLVLTSLLGLDRLLVLVLAVVHDLADGRLRVGGNLDEVEALLGSDALRVTNAEKTQLRAIDTDKTAGTSGDLPVNTGTIGFGYLTHLPFVAVCLVGTPRRGCGLALVGATARKNRSCDMHSPGKIQVNRSYDLSVSSFV